MSVSSHYRHPHRSPRFDKTFGCPLRLVAVAKWEDSAVPHLFVIWVGLVDENLTTLVKGAKGSTDLSYVPSRLDMARFYKIYCTTFLMKSVISLVVDPVALKISQA